MTATLTPNCVSSASFMRHGASLVAEASDLSHGGRLPLFGQVWPDSADEGLTVLSEWTGRRVVFVVTHVEVSDDNELMWWDLAPANPSDRVACVLRIFND